MTQIQKAAKTAMLTIPVNFAVCDDPRHEWREANEQQHSRPTAVSYSFDTLPGRCYTPCRGC